MPYCLYVRKSRADAEAEARGEGETLSRHINDLMALAKRRHLNVTKIHKEIVSGESIVSRPAMQLLLSEVEQGMWEGVLVVEIERLARGDTADQGLVAQTFKFSNTKIITLSKDYDPNNDMDEEYFEFGLFMSRREYKTINRRLQRGRDISVSEGKYVGSGSPYGYERIKITNDKGYTLKPIPEQAQVVKQIFTWLVEGEEQQDGSFRQLGCSLIVRRLNDLHIKPPRAEHWSPASVRDILHNPVYCGKIRWKWRPTTKRMVDGKIKRERSRMPSEQCYLFEGLHEAIISEELFQAAQEILKPQGKVPMAEKNSIKNPLAGIVICKACGRSMVRRPYGGKQPDTLICPNTACTNVSSKLESVEQSILDSLRSWITEYKLMWQLDNDTPKNDTSKLMELSLKKLQAEMTKLQAQLDTTHDLLEQGVYTIEQFIERSSKIAERIKLNQENQSVLQKDMKINKQRENAKQLIIPKVEHLLETYSALDSPKAKNDMLKEILEKIEYSKEKGGRWHSSPDDFQIDLYPRVPKDI